MIDLDQSKRAGELDWSGTSEGKLVMTLWVEVMEAGYKFKFYNSWIILHYPGCCHQEETKIAKTLVMMKSRNN